MSAADIVAAARAFADGLDVSLTEAGNARIHITRLADMIEQLITDLDARFEHSDHQSAKYYQRMRAAEREMHARELHHFEEEQKSAGLAAVVEKVRRVIGAEIGWESPAILIDRIQWALSTAPTDALAEHNRQVAERAWEEGARWAAVEFGKDASVDESRVGLVPSDNPYRKEQENNNA